MTVSTSRKKSKTKSPPPAFRQELLDELIGDYKRPEDLIGEDGVLKQLMGALINRAMEAEAAAHLGYDKGERPPADQSNRRNGTGRKAVRTDLGEVDVSIPRDREGSFEPELIGKHQRHFNGFDDKILAMYARGMSVRDIRSHLQEVYGVAVSPDLISRVTDAVVDELHAWQQRPLEPVYLVVYVDALMVKIREKGHVGNRAVYTVVGIAPDGRKEVLGLWVQATEGAKYWLSILEELKRRGARDIFILCADGLKGLPEAVEASFPQAVFQTCIVHMVRSSTRFVPWKDRKALCRDLREVYTAADEPAASRALGAFDEKWGSRFPMVSRSWRARWDEVTPFLEYPDEIRKAVYTTNAVEALHRQLRKVLKTKGHLPSAQAALKLLFLAIRNAEKTWGGRTRSWSTALGKFAIIFEDRMPELF